MKSRINEDRIFKNTIFLFRRNWMIIDSNMKIIWRRSTFTTPFTVGSGVLLVSRGSESLTRGISRVPDLRERGGDKEAMLDRSSSSGFIVTILD